MEGSRGSAGCERSEGIASGLLCVLHLLSVLNFFLSMIIPRRLRWLWLTLGVVFLDRASKAWIDSRPEEYFPHTLMVPITSTLSVRTIRELRSVFLRILPLR